MAELAREMEGRTALVTGGAKGIGAACCLAFFHFLTVG